MELLDTLDLMTVTGLHGAAIVGTSRGGIVAMLMAAVRPTALGALVLNDIGPVIETSGLARISGYAGKMPLPANWTEAGALMREMNGVYFPHTTEAEWEEVARQWYGERNGRPLQGYDPRLAHALTGYDASRPPPTLWAQFTAAGVVPGLALRGENSDILSEATFAEMTRRHPNLRRATIAGEGHAPLLRDEATVELIGDFLASADGAQP